MKRTKGCLFLKGQLQSSLYISETHSTACLLSYLFEKQLYACLLLASSTSCFTPLAPDPYSWSSMLSDRSASIQHSLSSVCSFTSSPSSIAPGSSSQDCLNLPWFISVSSTSPDYKYNWPVGRLLPKPLKGLHLKSFEQEQPKLISRFH